jgi:hypothetical protein
MKAALVPVEPVQQDVTLTMSHQEARDLVNLVSRIGGQNWQKGTPPALRTVSGLRRALTPLVGGHDVQAPRFDWVYYSSLGHV